MKSHCLLSKSALTMAALSFCLLSSCIDDDYDLSDIDTTVDLQFKDLTLPINIDEIKLKSIIELDETSIIKVIGDSYVFIEEGDFQSSSISIPKISASAPKIAPVHTTLLLASSIPDTPENITLTFPIGTKLSDFEYRQNNVSDCIVEVDKIATDFDIKINLAVSGLPSGLKGWYLSDLVLLLPKGLTGTTNLGNYNPETGEVAIEELYITSNSTAFTMNVTGIDIAAASISYNSSNHVFQFADKVGIQSGDVIINTKDLTSSEPQISTVDFNISFDLSALDVVSFTGTIQYDIDGIDIDDFELTDIPGILNQDYTDIILVNPQIYLSINNPTAQYGLSAQSGLTIHSYRSGEPAQSYSLDNGYFEVGHDKGNAAYNFCMSPIVPEEYYNGYNDATHVPFTSLSYVLSGNGLPSSIGVTLDEPQIPQQKVTDFVLGQELGAVKGNYALFAPLALKVGSEIIYTSTENGWSDEDLDDMTINELELDATITNNLPIDIEITAYPIDTSGNRIGNVEIVGASVHSGATDEQLCIKTTGVITHLDGIVFEAKAYADESEESFKPEEHIVITNLKVKATGHYLTEL